MEIPSDYAKAITALGLEESAKYTKKTYNLPDSEESIINEWMNDVKKAYIETVPLKANVGLFLEYLKDESIPIAVATANTKECYEPCLKRLGIYDKFDFIYDVKNIKGGKNSPQVFLSCSDRYGIDPSEILVFEDSLVALKTAKDSGFKTCAVYEEVCKDEELKKEIADLYIKDFTELLQ